ncbi:hypothetical protein [Marinobacterium lacunae]|uniref:hypothetical protein n=1 Tax=Marinobacterium lacunae TaxID=1232683 RepID=UPI00055E0532|nr:hypothetical protein [Marinobacterium lacunae]
MADSNVIKMDFDDALRLVGLYELKDAVFGHYLVGQLVKFQHGQEINPRAVVDEIRHLEGMNKSSRTKKASKFKSGKIAGFWHKHFFEARHMPFNIAQHHLDGKTGEISGSAERIIRRIFDPNKSSVVTKEMIGEMSHTFSIAAYEQRSKERSLTGDWIIYKKHMSKNYYLCVCPHNINTDRLYENLYEIYHEIMPFLFE